MSARFSGLAAFALTATISCMPAYAAKHHAADKHYPIELAPGPSISATPGTVVRWTVPGTQTCSMGSRHWDALGDTCYYPIDLMEKPGVLTVHRNGAGHSETARIDVGAFLHPVQQVELGDTPQADPTPEEMKRAVRDEEKVDRVFARKEGPGLFALPLGSPAKKLPDGRDFGANRIFNDTPAGQPHMGADYTIVAGTPVHAVADGTVALAEDQFFAGNGVYIDHGDGLVSMYFHLSKMKVKAGQAVKKGQVIGLVGSTGRSTGAHLYFGVRWHNARIDPTILLDDPAKIPALGEATPGAVTAQGN